MNLFVRKTIYPVLENLDYEALKPLLSQKGYATGEQEFKKRFAEYKEFGSFISCSAFETNFKEYRSLEGNKFLLAFSKGYAQFENAVVTVYAVFIQEKNQWKLLDLQLELQYMPPVPGEAQFNIPNPLKEYDFYTRDLERFVIGTVLTNSKQMRRYADKIFELAEIYERQNQNFKALNLYENGLTADSENFERRLEYARLLLKLYRYQEAASVLRQIAKFSSDRQIVAEAQRLLDFYVEDDMVSNSAQISPVTDQIEIVLINIDDVPAFVMQDLRKQLQETLKIKIRISEKSPAFNRNDFIYISGRRSDIAQRQFDAPEILYHLMTAFPYDINDRLGGFLGITTKDIYKGEEKFVFSDTLVNYGILSVARLRKGLSNQPLDQQKLIDRLQKQAAKMIYSMLGIPFCENTLCLRSQADSLWEYDAKRFALCEKCIKNLNALKSNPVFPEQFALKLPEIYFTVAKDLLQFKKSYEATALLIEAMKIDHHFWNNHRALKVALNQSHILQEVLNVYVGAAQRHPNRRDMQNVVGYLYELKSLYDDARNVYRNILNTYEADELAHYNMSVLEYHLKHYSQALSHFDRALELNYRPSADYEALMEQLRPNATPEKQ